MITNWKTFAQEAGLYVDVNGQPWPRNMNGEDIEGAYARFAELIVRECMNVLDPGEHQLIARFQARKWLAEHFRVEE